MEKNDTNLERLIHQELVKLPDRPAPAALVGSVLAEIHRREQRAWWQSPWIHWPAGFRAASIPCLLAGIAAIGFALLKVWNSLDASAELETLTDSIGPLSTLWELAAALGNALVVITHTVNQEYIVLTMAAAFIMYLACVGLGTLCYRIVATSR